MGSLWAGTLGTVTNVCLYTKWKEHIRKINLQGGIIVQSLDGGRRRVDCNTASTPSDVLKFGRPEIGFVFAKGVEETFEAGRIAAQLLSTGGVLVSLQNGMGREETLLDAIGSVNRTDKLHLAIGTTSHGAIVEPGIVTHQGSGDTALASAEMEVSERIASLLTDCGIETRAVLQCEKEAMLWRKLIINCAINPLTAIFGVQNGYIFRDQPQGLREISARVARETFAVSDAVPGVHNAFASEEDAVAAVLRVSEMTQANTSSMLTDILKRKQTEIESINGWVCSMAKRRGCDAPLNQKLCEMIRNIEASQEMNDCLHQLHSEVSTLKHVQELLDVSEPFR